jgi:biotin operon repressor
MIRWRKILDVFAGYGRQIRFVPGHGPVCGQETVRDQINIFDDLRAHAEKMRHAGVPVEIAEQHYRVPKAYRRFDTSAWHYCVGSALLSYYAGSG